MKLLAHGVQFPLQFISPDLALVSPKLALEITISISAVQPWETVINNRYHGDEGSTFNDLSSPFRLNECETPLCNFDWAPHILQYNGVGHFLEDLMTMDLLIYMVIQSTDLFRHKHNYSNDIFDAAAWSPFKWLPKRVNMKCSV